ncbi:MAG: ABC transporter ATP-binding protein [Anaerocolumna sp.]
MKAIEINNLTKSYGKSRGVTDVNLTVMEGEIFGFIGPNGAGKSTTIRTLLGLIHPTIGFAKIFGKSCITCPEVRNQVGYLPSEVFYYDDMKVIELLKYSASFYKKDCIKRIHELADIMDLDLNKKIDNLSYGNKKKVGIVQGLLHEPKLIILDEPTSGLDPLMQQRFFELIQQENKKGATVFFSSHILSEVQKLCDQVAFIKEGKILKVEKMSVLQENNYKRMKIETVNDLDATLFHLEGVNNLVVNQNTASFIFKGNINLILRKVAELEVRNITVDDPDLEEIFMHYYTKEV